MSFEESNQIEAALDRLGRKLAYEYADPIALVVCGGSALNVLNIANRTTRDVDVLALVEEGENGMELHYDRPLPEFFRDVVAGVGRDLNLPEDWLNMGPKDVLARFGEPDGLMERWECRKYGPSLTVYYVGRLDQVHFKLLAAVAPNSGPHHFEDLKERIKPSEQEIRAAISWLLNRKTSQSFRDRVNSIVEKLGHENVSRDITE